jgi:Ca2+-binding EF-hand superfamily protein
MGCGASHSPSPAFVAAPVPREDSQSERLRRVFKLIDKDGSGHIDKREFLLTAKHGDDAAELGAVFEYLDSQDDKDGRILEDEWVSGMLKLHSRKESFEHEIDLIEQSLAAYAMSGQAFETAAAQGGEFDDEPGPRQAASSVSQVSATGPSRERSAARSKLLREVFTAMDVDHDGQVDLREFQRTASPEDKDELVLLFELLFDQSGDGVLSYQEWADGMDKLRPEDGTAESEAAFEAEMHRMLEALSVSAKSSSQSRAGEKGPPPGAAT